MICGSSSRPGSRPGSACARASTAAGHGALRPALRQGGHTALRMRAPTTRHPPERRLTDSPAMPPHPRPKTHSPWSPTDPSRLVALAGSAATSQAPAPRKATSNRRADAKRPADPSTLRPTIGLTIPARGGGRGRSSPRTRTTEIDALPQRPAPVCQSASADESHLPEHSAPARATAVPKGHLSSVMARLQALDE